MTEPRRLTPRFRPARRIERTARPTPIVTDQPSADSGGPQTDVPVSEATSAGFVAPEAASDDPEGIPLRFVTTEEAHGLAPGTEIYVDGYPYGLEVVRLRQGSRVTPPYFGLRMGRSWPGSVTCGRW
jgi:hypothetical protein